MDFLSFITGEFYLFHPMILSNTDGPCYTKNRKSAENRLRNIQVLIASVVDVGAVSGEHAAGKS